jgi:hypothetical protein
MELREIAHARAGDKGNIVNISLIAFRGNDYPALEQQITAERVTDRFSSIITRPVERYCVPGLAALNFVLYRPSSESVTRSLALDAHGKALSFALLSMDIDLDEMSE